MLCHYVFVFSSFLTLERLVDIQTTSRYLDNPLIVLRSNSLLNTVPKQFRVVKEWDIVEYLNCLCFRFVLSVREHVNHFEII